MRCHCFLPLRYNQIRCVPRSHSSHQFADASRKVLCGVTIAGQGSRLERSLKSALPSASLGALTIESHANTSEPLLCHVDLPSELCRDREQASEAKVLLLDSQVGTGAAAIMALRVLLDHGVMEEAIILVCFVCSRRGGCRALSAAFPCVFPSSFCDDELEIGAQQSEDRDECGG